MKKIYIIKENDTSSRLDRWIKRNLSNIPQSLIEKNIRKGNIKVNNKKKKGSFKLTLNDKISVYNFNFKANENKKVQTRYDASKTELKKTSGIFIEDNENYVVINKPAGIAVQSGTKTRKNIIDILRSTKEFDGVSPFTVHRLDKETTGILIVAKNRKFAQLFTSLFRIRKIHKTYLGISVGTPNKTKGIMKDELIYYEGEKKSTVQAITNYQVLDSNNNYSLLKLNPVTGRKHQIRKQLLINGTPILGDSKYRITKNYPSKKNELMLHAYKINFSIAGIKYSFYAEPPENFVYTLKQKYLKIY